MIRQKGQPRPIHAPKGFALLVVIVVMLLTTFLASQLILLVRTELKIARNAKTRAASRYLAEAGINFALFKLLESPTESVESILTTAESEDWTTTGFLQGHQYEAMIPEGRIQFYAVNESGKINLNWPENQMNLLRLFLQYQNLGPDEVETIIDSLLDWRDTDDLHRLNGAEQEYYLNRDEPYIPRNGPLTDPSEFFLIKGTEALVGRFDPYAVFTVQNSTGDKININSLTPTMLDFLVANNPDGKETYLVAQQETNGNLTAEWVRQILGDERYELLIPHLVFTAAATRGYYFVVATGQAEYVSPSQAQKMPVPAHAQRFNPGLRISTLLKLEGDNVQYLLWKEDLL